MALGDLIQPLLEQLISRLKVLFGPFGKLFNLLAHFWNSLQSLGAKINSLVALILSEVNEWRNFQENVAYRTKIISLPVAIAHVQEFWAQIVAAWQAVLELVQQLRGKFETTGNPTQEAEDAIRDIEQSSFKGLVSKFPKLFKGLEKVLGFVAIVLDALESIIVAIDDLTTIVNALKAIREDVESGGPIFLKQSNRRKIVTLEDGTTMKIRLGNLHS